MEQIESIEAILRLEPQIVVRDPAHEDSRESDIDCIATQTKVPFLVTEGSVMRRVKFHGAGYRHQTNMSDLPG